MLFWIIIGVVGTAFIYWLADWQSKQSDDSDSDNL